MMEGRAQSAANRRLWTVGGHLDSSSTSPHAAREVLEMTQMAPSGEPPLGQQSAGASSSSSSSAPAGGLKFLSTLSSHALDTTLGKPASSVPVALYRLRPSGGPEDWEALFSAATDSDGRVTSSVYPPVSAGTWKLRFDTASYFQRIGVTKFLYPYVDIVFTVESGQHYHVPLLLSAHGYSTYRGS